MRAFAGRYDVEALMGCDARKPELAGVGAYTELDVRDENACQRVLQRFRPTHVLHAAAVTAGVSDAEMHAVNATGTSNMVQAAMQVGSVQRILLLSSSGVYGSAQLPQSCDEEYPLDLSSSYAASKREAEQCLLQAEARSGITMVVARVGPCYGPQERVSAFRPQQSLIGCLLTLLRSGEVARVHGESCSRDWMHVDDLSVAIKGLLTSLGLQHRMYNVSSGVAVEARDVLDAFRGVGLRVQQTESPEQANIILKAAHGRKAMVIERLCSDTGFTPSVGIREGIERLLRETGSQPVVQACHAEAN